VPDDPPRPKQERFRRAGVYALYGLLLVVAVVPAVLVLDALRPGDKQTNAVADDKAMCREVKGKQAAPNNPENPGIELQSNRARPTLAIALADRQSAVDSISFSTKDRLLVPDTRRERTSAVLLETPRRSATEPFDGDVKVKASPLVGGTIVRLTACVDRGSILKAGAFQGTARIYGPKVADFDYAVIVTEKWPWQIAVAILWYAGLAFVIVAWLTGSLAFGHEKRVIPVAGGIVVGLIAMVPTFFGTYWNNATWGSDPGTHVSGLATAGLTAALAGLAAAHKVLGGNSEQEHVETPANQQPQLTAGDDNDGQ
jgi:hypothetical protein